MNLFAKSLPFVVIMLIGVAGCGLSEYQTRMDEQRVRIKEFDDANRGLDDPIEIPLIQLEKPKEPPKDAPKDVKEEAKDPGQKAWNFDFYLRLPKGFGATPKDKTPYFFPFPCYRYSGGETGNDIFVAAAQIAEDTDQKTKEKEVFDKWYRANFRYFTRMAIQEYYAKTHNKLDLKMPDKEKYQVVDVKTLSPFSDVTTRIAYQYIDYSDAGPKINEPTLFRVYYHEQPATVKDGVREPGRQIAIVVHRPFRSDDAFEKACLRSLDATSDAGVKRAQYKKATRR